MEVKEHLLYGEDTNYVEATSYGRNRTIVPDTIIIHYTAGPSGDATVRLFSAKNAKLSAHLVAHEDGRMTQMLPFNKKGYHAGRSSYDGRTSFNGFSIGIEISNPGYLLKNPKGSGYVTWWEKRRTKPKPVDESVIFEGKHRNAVTKVTRWHTYPQEQIDAVKKVCQAIFEAYDIKYILGHEEIAPGRKADPGPAFPLDELRDEIFNKKPMTMAQILAKAVSPKNVIKSGIVTAKLNFRAGSSTDSEILTAPLPKHSKVGVIKEEAEWINISHKIKGWVHKGDIEYDNTDNEGDAYVNVDTLVMKTKPEDKAGLVKNPLKKDDKIYIHDHDEDWVEITAYISGWLMKKYIKFV